MIKYSLNKPHTKIIYSKTKITNNNKLIKIIINFKIKTNKLIIIILLVIIYQKLKKILPLKMIIIFSGSNTQKFKI